MIITKPTYYDAFRCIASCCPDSCCKEWEVQVDPKSANFYRNLTGSLGDALRDVLRMEDKDVFMTVIDGRCPMWREDGLCRIQAELGEAALCKTCREFPRLKHDYGDFVELGLELSCPEAAKFILESADFPMISAKTDGGEEAEYDTETMAILKATRETARSILADSWQNPGQALAALLLYGCQVQGEIDGDDPMPFDKNSALDLCADLVKRAANGTQTGAQGAAFDEQQGHFAGLSCYFSSLEILTPTWKQRLQTTAMTPLAPKVLPLARYFVDRYWLQAVSDYDLYCRVKFMVVSCILVSGLGGDFTETAQLYAKEIENNIDNVEAILDAAYTHRAFTDDKILGLLHM